MRARGGIEWRWWRRRRRSASWSRAYPGSSVVTSAPIEPLYGAMRPSSRLNSHLPPGRGESRAHACRRRWPGAGRVAIAPRIYVGGLPETSIVGGRMLGRMLPVALLFAFQAVVPQDSNAYVDPGARDLVRRARERRAGAEQLI